VSVFELGKKKNVSLRSLDVGYERYLNSVWALQLIKKWHHFGLVVNVFVDLILIESKEY